MKIIIPLGNWPMAIVEALDRADDEITLVVDDEDKRELVLRAAQRMGKRVTVEVVTHSDARQIEARP